MTTKRPRDLAQLTAGLGAPAIHIVKQDAPNRSHFGGEPNLPEQVRWPERNGARLGFLARLSLADLHQAVALEWLPATGALLFFYDLDAQPWGFDPKDRGSWAVLDVPDLAAPASAPGDGAQTHVPIAFSHVGFRRIESLPGCERDPIAKLGFGHEELGAYSALRDATYGDDPKHHVGGFPDHVQGDIMELEAQLVSNGLYCGDASGYEDPRRQALEPGAEEWRLLLQFDTDDDLGVMWGDCGMLYFWVRQQDARKGDFRDTWLVLQCG